MISLEYKCWDELHDAYGPASKIPELLKQLLIDSTPTTKTEDEPWFSLWSSLCHQGDVYPASFAAVPYLADIALRTSYDFAWDFFALPACIEIARNNKKLEVPEELKQAYFDALKKLYKLALTYKGHTNLEPTFLRSVQGMVLLGEGKFIEAENLLDPEI